ncbi:MFS transporter [Streptomyces spectabilis]|uniref:MFS family permease n=1 Tax=Streptomyces spectabilis TaxID=68270 RepID=A0A5P2X2F6_STRST|nr:MFS transporter [Streptomyces spectabilis]MBB5108902.1 MFS family permease [Streptomyces spectabilis]MCI3899804.1 MFS transporter [Streptomyces spectabilis]QEV57469.1 MFS transporter [Streptomyces spectabilis]GGV42822.1 MFS transporter [Streptomyces spectabilis]
MSLLTDVRKLPGPCRGLLLLSLVNNLGTGLVMPFLVVYVHEVRGLDVTVATTALACFSGAAVLGAPLAGWLADRSGARPVAALAMLVQAVGFAGYACATDAVGFAATASAAGLGVGGLAAWYTLLAEAAPEGMTSVVFGLSYSVGNAAMGLGGLAAAAVVSVTRPVSFQVLYVADAATCLLVAVLLLRVRAPAREAPAPGGTGRAPATASYAVVYRSAGFMAVLLVGGLLLASSFAQLESGLPAYLTQEAGVTPRQLGLVFALDTAAIIVSQFLLHDLLKRARPSPLIACAGGLWAVSWALVALAARLDGDLARLASIGVAVVVFGTASTCFVAGMPTLVNQLAPPGARGRYNAAWSMAKSLGFMAGPLTAGAFLDRGLGTAYLVGLAVICAVTALAHAASGLWLRTGPRAFSERDRAPRVTEEPTRSV